MPITSLLWHYGVSSQLWPTVTSLLHSTKISIRLLYLRWNVSRSAPLPEWSFPAGTSFPSRLCSTWGFPPETSIAPKLCSTREICRKDSTLICRKTVLHPKLAKEIYLEVRAVGDCKGQMPTKKAQGLYGAFYGQRLSSEIFRVEIGQVSTPELADWLDFKLSCWLVLSSKTGWFQLSEIGWFHVQ